MSLLDRFRKKEKKKIEKIEKKKEKLVPRADTGLGEKPEKKKETVKLSGKNTVLAYQVIKEPHITEKAGSLGEQNKYVFKVYPNANKMEVKKAVEALYNTKVKNVNMIHSAPKRRRLGRAQGWRGGLKRGFKKAIVTLKEGEKIELLAR